MKKNKIKEDRLVYLLLLSSFLILFITLEKYTFTIKETSITYSYLIVPILLLITNIIYKRLKLNELLKIIILSLIVLLVFITIINFSLGLTTNFNELIRPIISLIISIIINIIILTLTIKKYKSIYLLILLNYLFSIITYNIIYQLFLRTNIDYTYYMILLPIELFIVIIISIIDKIKIRYK